MSTNPDLSKKMKTLLILRGPAGSGKTTLAGTLFELFGSERNALCDVVDAYGHDDEIGAVERAIEKFPFVVVDRSEVTITERHAFQGIADRHNAVLHVATLSCPE